MVTTSFADRGKRGSASARLPVVSRAANKSRAEFGHQVADGISVPYGTDEARVSQCLGVFTGRGHRYRAARADLAGGLPWSKVHLDKHGGAGTSDQLGQPVSVRSFDRPRGSPVRHRVGDDEGIPGVDLRGEGG